VLLWGHRPHKANEGAIHESYWRHIGPRVYWPDPIHCRVLLSLLCSYMTGKRSAEGSASEFVQQIHVRASKNVSQPLDIGTDVCRIISVLLERGSHSAERNCTKPNCMKRVRTDLIRVAPSNPRTIGSVCMRRHRRRYRRRVLWCRERIAGGRRRFTHRRRRETPHNAPHKGPGWSSRQHGQISTEV